MAQNNGSGPAYGNTDPYHTLIAWTDFLSAWFLVFIFLAVI
jgi:hypothetical protein